MDPSGYVLTCFNQGCGCGLWIRPPQLTSAQPPETKPLLWVVFPISTMLDNTKNTGLSRNAVFHGIPPLHSIIIHFYVFWWVKYCDMVIHQWTCWGYPIFRQTQILFLWLLNFKTHICSPSSGQTTQPWPDSARPIRRPVAPLVKNLMGRTSARAAGILWQFGHILCHSCTTSCFDPEDSRCHLAAAVQ